MTSRRRVEKSASYPNVSKSESPKVILELEPTVDFTRLASVPHDTLSFVGSQLILAFNLLLSAVPRGRSSPDVNVVFFILPYPCASVLAPLFMSELPLTFVGACFAGVLEDQVLLGVWRPYNLTLFERAGSSGHSERVIVCTFTTCGVAATAVVGCLGTCWVVIGETVKSVLDVLDGGTFLERSFGQALDKGASG